jgi:hypothetical protein
LISSPSTDDILSTYRKEESSDAPPCKKLRTETSIVGYETETVTVRRNPFARSLRKDHVKSVDMDSLQSPTKITDKNYSMIQNLSPVKRIPSVFSKKLSRFSRTAIDDKQKVVSRFFTTSTSTTTSTSEEADSPEIDENDDKVVLIMPILKTPPPKVRLEEYAPMEDDDDNDQDDTEKCKQMVSVIRSLKAKYEAAKVYLKSPEATLKDRGDKTPKKQKPLSSNYGDVHEPDLSVSKEVDLPEKVSSSPLSAKSDETTDNDVIDCDDYEEKAPTRCLPVGKSTNLLRQQQFGNKCRVSGLMRNRKGAAATKNIVNQSTLSMFGFQKRWVLLDS